MASDDEKLDDELEREQGLVDLEQAISDRGQQISDKKQDEIEAEQTALDEERSKTGNGHARQSRDFDNRQAGLDRARKREQAVKGSLEQAQTERETAQRKIDRQRGRGEGDGT